MDQRDSHLQADRVKLLMDAAKAVQAYAAAHREPLPDPDYFEGIEPIIVPSGSGETKG
jgi:hypothetical protein